MLVLVCFLLLLLNEFLAGVFRKRLNKKKYISYGLGEGGRSSGDFLAGVITVMLIYLQ